MKPFVFGIAGGSGSGKSSLAFGLEKTFPSLVCLFQLDDYFRPEADVPQRAHMTNWDSPQALYYTKMVHDLANLKASKSVVINTKRQSLNPNFLETGKRIPVEFKPKPLIIVEGFLALHYPKIRRLLDLSVFLDAPFYVQSGRRLHDKTPEDFPLGYDKLVLRPMHDRYVSPSKIHASVTLNVANMSQQQVLDKVTALIVPHLT